MEIKWKVSFQSKFTRFFEDKFCTSKSHYTANIFPTTILIKEEELDSPTLVVNVNHFWGIVDHLGTIHHPQAFSLLLYDFLHHHDAFLLLNSTSLMISLGKMMPTLLLFATSVLFNRWRTGMLWLKIISARSRGVFALLLIQITHLILCFAAVQTVWLFNFFQLFWRDLPKNVFVLVLAHQMSLIWTRARAVWSWWRWQWWWWWFVATISPDLQTALARVLDELGPKRKHFYNSPAKISSEQLR